MNPLKCAASDIHSYKSLLMGVLPCRDESIIPPSMLSSNSQELYLLCWRKCQVRYG